LFEANVLRCFKEFQGLSSGLNTLIHKYHTTFFREYVVTRIQRPRALDFGCWWETRQL
jgi:hypothetical protein